MTEKHARRRINYPAFFVALICGPLAVTGLTFWINILFYMAPVIGLPIYLLFAPPVLIWFLRRHPPAYLPILLLALISVLGLIPIMSAFSLYAGNADIFAALPTIMILGAIFAAIWSTAFTAIYKFLTRKSQDQ